MTTSGRHRKSIGPRLRGAGLDGDQIAEADFAAQGLFDRAGDALAAPRFVSSRSKAAEIEMVSTPDRRYGEDLRVNDIGARGGASPRDDRQQAGMVGR